ncbi:MAG TPA: serine/threonine protein kinase [Planctomycetaceae bacterium]|nr:serine/threonine protein kinase [Planctomycetaceae bacterium]
MRKRLQPICQILGAITCSMLCVSAMAADDFDAVAEVKKEIAKASVGKGDWPQWAGTPLRNNVSDQQNIPVEWDVVEGINVRWSAPLGTETYGNPVVANGQIYVGTNNGHGYTKRFPAEVDLGVLLCFKESDGSFLWQHSSEKLPPPDGRSLDWPEQGICCAPLVDGERLWYVTSRGEVVCLDAMGFHDGENDGITTEPSDSSDEADVVWSFDMMKELGVRQHNMAACSVTGAGDKLFINTSNGTDEEGHIVNADAPSFICLNRETGKLLWADNSPGENLLHGQWSSPAYAVLGGQPQVLFGGGDGYLYSFDPEGADGKGKMLWKFDCNPKESFYEHGPGATRNHIIATPVVYDGLVYVAVGEDPELGEGQGHLWCIDPTKRGDVSPTLVFNEKSGDKPIEHKRFQALVKDDGDVERENPNSALVWHYMGENLEDFEGTMHRTCGTVAIKDDFLFLPDFSGVIHCLNAKTGKAYWTFDMFSASWASPLIVEDRVYIGDEDGYMRVFKLSEKMEQIGDDQSMDNSVFTTPVAANGTLFIANRSELFAIEEGAQSQSDK